jgi:hypothetical protein
VKIAIRKQALAGYLEKLSENVCLRLQRGKSIFHYEIISTLETQCALLLGAVVSTKVTDDERNLAVRLYFLAYLSGASGHILLFWPVGAENTETRSGRN